MRRTPLPTADRLSRATIQNLMTIGEGGSSPASPPANAFLELDDSFALLLKRLAAVEARDAEELRKSS
jgi:hypothetical protein